MENILMWLTGGVEVFPEVLIIVKLSLMMFAYNCVMDLMGLFVRGSRSL